MASVARVGSMDRDLALLRDVLELLAAPPARQTEALAAFREAAEQIRDGVVDMVQLHESLMRRGALSPAAAASIHEIDARFDAMIEAGDEMFTVEALESASEWREVRELARRALALLRA